MKELRDLMRLPQSRWVHRKAHDTLKGHSRAAAINAFKYIEQADVLSDKYHTLAFFCITHATEEAVVAVMMAARDNGYGEHITKFRHHVHPLKAVVTYFAQQIGDYLTGAKIAIAHEPGQDMLVIRDSRPPPPLYAPLSLKSFAFYPEGGQRWSGNLDQFAAQLSSSMGFMSGCGFQVLIRGIIGLGWRQQPV